MAMSRFLLSQQPRHFTPSSSTGRYAYYSFGIKTYYKYEIDLIILRFIRDNNIREH